MNNFGIDEEIEMLRLGEDEDVFNGTLTSEAINLKKRASKLMSSARSRAKLKQCILCGKECSSFCDSHSVPKFVLRNVAENGMLSTTLQGKMLFYEKNTGINKAGTFHIICNNCDNEGFQEYEAPNAFLKVPTNTMLAQMALKDYLLLICKKIENREAYALLGEQYPENKDFAEEKAFIEQFDLDNYMEKFKYAQNAIRTPEEKRYHLCYYQKLDYIVPYAAQSAVTLISGFNDEVINNVYNFSSEYEIKEIHVAVFPLETTSVVMLYIEEGEKRYRNFYRQLNKLPLDDQLATINYIIFAYIEDVYINPTIQEKVRDHKGFDDACRMTTDTTSNFLCSPEEQLSKAITEFSLSKRNNLPNLLSKEYALSSSIEVE